MFFVIIIIIIIIIDRTGYGTGTIDDETVIGIASIRFRFHPASDSVAVTNHAAAVIVAMLFFCSFLVFSPRRRYCFFEF